MDIKSSILHYCRYQERCHAEVRNKLYELGCRTPEVEQHISELIQSEVLNEERYARAFARGKFRMQQWGRQKIIQQLKFHKISEYCIKKALTEIDEDAYESTIKKLLEKKLPELRKERSERIRKAKLQRYLMQKGYESGLVLNIINDMLKTKGE